ncbi:MAG: BlaI/MecI/CopY family transcriptional regulator [Bacteroidetes bacterium]|nr:BlaI/MecI/CopY family transcriptional regulator [Bacteroidota bacterium]
MEELTKAEERVMLIIWKLQKAFVKDILADIDDEPKPPYNTISSVARILASKGYLKYNSYGKTYEYYPAISKSEYRKLKVKKMLSGYFSDSPSTLLSFMINEEKLNKKEIEKMKEIIKQIK